MPKPSATLKEMNCPCGYKFLSDSIKNFRRIGNKSVRVCSECYRKTETVEIEIKGSIVKDEKLGNKIVWK